MHAMGSQRLEKNHPKTPERLANEPKRKTSKSNMRSEPQTPSFSNM